jgi:hypothetical protein
VGIHENAKLFTLAAMAKCTRERALWCLTRLWLWAVQQGESNVTELTAEFIAEVSGWGAGDGDANVWVDALYGSRLLTVKVRGPNIAGWDRLVEPHIEALAKKRARNARYYASSQTPYQPPLRRHISHPTEQNRTEQKEEENTAQRQPRRTSRTQPISDEAKFLIAAYEEMSGHKAASRVSRMVQRRLTNDPGFPEEIAKATANYKQHLQDNPPESKKYIIAPHNWFGQAARFKEYIDAPEQEPASKHGRAKNAAPDLKGIDHTPSKDSVAYGEFRDRSVNAAWSNMTADEQQAAAALVHTKLDGSPAWDRLPEDSKASSALAAAKRSCAASVPDFDAWVRSGRPEKAAGPNGEPRKG